MEKLECIRCHKKGDGIELFTPVIDGLLCERCYKDYADEMARSIAGAATKDMPEPPK